MDNNDDTPTGTTEPLKPSVPLEDVLEHYASELATMTQRALVAEAMVARLMARATP